MLKPIFGRPVGEDASGREPPVLVVASRPGQTGSCLKCLYVHRGSFKQIPLPTLVLQMQQHGQLKDKLLDYEGKHA